MFHMGSADRDTGPTIILPEGKTKRAMLNNDYLVQKGLKLESTILVIEKSFITHDSGYESSKNII